MIIERTQYYAKPGRAAEILANRREASRIRVSLGLSAGTIYAKKGGDGPDVTWECSFPDEATHKADLAARDKSPEFEKIRAKQRDALARFERLRQRHAPRGLADPAAVRWHASTPDFVPQGRCSCWFVGWVERSEDPTQSHAPQSCVGSELPLDPTYVRPAVNGRNTFTDNASTAV